MSCRLLRARSGAWRRAWRWSVRDAHGAAAAVKLAPGASERAQRLVAGQRLHGYSVQRVVPVPDLFLTAVALRHDRTGAQHLHLARDDPNNLFSVQLATTPRDSTGVPHILEHVALCGSRRFPCRDPFFKMLNRSLATFMNAFTASDYTMYPFSTQNPQDFRNLLSVYLDAVFFPRLLELDFWQEGWRLEHEDPKDPGTPLALRGVVFNEMKGAFADREQLFCQHAQNALQPEHTYGVVSGGHPAHIPELTWEGLRAFHAAHYHPSNAQFMTYGDLPLEPTLQQIEAEALSHFERIQPDTAVPSQPHWSQPREVHVTCEADPLAPDPSKQTTVSVSFLLGDITEVFESFVLNVVSSLLVSGPSAPFYRALLESGMGSHYAPVTGYDGSTRDAAFGVGLQGVAPGDVERVTSAVHATIASVVRTGFEAERIEALLHKMELGLKHQGTNFGLTLATALASSWGHGGDPVEMLRVDAHVRRLRSLLATEPSFLQDAVKRHLQDNPHRLTLVMTPDPGYAERQAEKEAETLRALAGGLSAEERERVHHKGLELLALQDCQEDVSFLPTLRVSDIDPQIPRTHTRLTWAERDVPVQVSEQPTNGVVSFRALLSLAAVPCDLQPLVPLFCHVLAKVGCGDMDYRQLSQWIDLRTGGLDASTSILPDHSQLDYYQKAVVLHSVCLDRNVAEMMQIWTDIFTGLRFVDAERLRTLALMLTQELSNGVASNGHRYAMTSAAGSLSPAGRLGESLHGLAQVSLMKRVAEQQDLTPILEDLQRIANHLLHSGGLRCAVNATPAGVDSAVSAVCGFVRSVAEPGVGFGPAQPDVITLPLPYETEASGRTAHRTILTDPAFRPREMKTHFQMPFPVNFVTQCVRAVPFTHRDFASLRVLARLMSAKFLHREIREKGGAYGGGATIAHDTLAFYSYRDPGSLDTLAAFRRASEWACKGSFSERDVEEAKLSVFSAVDAPVAPGDKGMSLFLHGVSDSMRQQHRERLFAVTHASLTDIANRFLDPVSGPRAVVLLGPQNQDVSRDPSWTSC
ncbi:presequence protease, mitochondrial [Lampetra fluviatilis]